MNDPADLHHSASAATMTAEGGRKQETDSLHARLVSSSWHEAATDVWLSLIGHTATLRFKLLLLSGSQASSGNSSCAYGNTNAPLATADRV